MDKEPQQPPVNDHDEDDAAEGVVIPEEFQQQCHELLKGADKACLAHVRDRVYAREDELRKAEQAKQNGKGGKSKVNFSTENAPASISS